MIVYARVKIKTHLFAAGISRLVAVLTWSALALRPCCSDRPADLCLYGAGVPEQRTLHDRTLVSAECGGCLWASTLFLTSGLRMAALVRSRILAIVSVTTAVC